MAWQMKGSYYSPCSCNVGCPCTFGELEADRGWCSGAVAIAVQSGNVDGVDLSGTKAALVADWPGGFLGGNGTGRLYFDPSDSAEQRAALERVLSGKAGGVFEALSTLVPTFLPPKEAAIDIRTGADEMRVTVGEFGEMVIKPLKGPTGENTRLLHGAAAFRDDINLGRGTGSRWHDPEMRQWESGGHAEFFEFDWSA